MMQQGGVSKATKMLNLSEASQSSYHLNQLKMSMARDVFHIAERLKDELLPLDLLMWHGPQDIFAGMDFTLRQGMIGEDVCNLNQVSWWSTTPETKTMYQIPKLFELVRKLSPNRFRSFWPHVCGSHLKGTPPVHRASRISPCWQGTRFGLQFGAGGMVGMVRSHELELTVASQILDCHCISIFSWLPTVHCKLWQPAGAVLLRQVVTGHRWTTAHSTNVPPWTRNGHSHCWQGGQWFVVWRCNMRCWCKHRSFVWESRKFTKKQNQKLCRSVYKFVDLFSLCLKNLTPFDSWQLILGLEFLDRLGWKAVSLLLQLLGPARVSHVLGLEKQMSITLVWDNLHGVLQ